MSLQTKIDTLHRTTHELLYLGLDGEPVYADRFSELNANVYRQAEALVAERGNTIEEEASLCATLLTGYSATFCNHGDKDAKIQSVLNRSWDILDHLSASLLKCQLLVACYSEVFEEELLEEAHTIIHSWGSKKLSEEEQEVIDNLRNLEANPRPWSEIE